MSENLLKILKAEIEVLEDGYKNLEYSYNVCMKIGIKSNYSLEELESYEALCARFARVSDILIQKVLKTIDIIDLETPGTVRDRINNAHKKDIISDAEKLIEIRILRNEISHEYLPDAFRDIFVNVINHCEFLFECIKSINQYSKTKFNV